MSRPRRPRALAAGLAAAGGLLSGLGRESRRRTRALLGLALGLGVAGVLLYLTLRNAQLGDVRERVAAVDLRILALAPLVTAAGVVASAFRSRVLFARLRRIPFYRLAKSVLVAHSLNNIMPLRFGEVARVGYLAHFAELPASTCLAVVAVERVVDVFVLAVLLSATLPAVAIELPLGASLYLTAGVLVSATAVAVIVSRRPDGFVALATSVAGLLGESMRRFVGRQAASFARGLAGLRSLPAVVAVVVLSALCWLLAVVSIRLWIASFGLALPWYAPVVLLAFLSLGLAVPSTPGHVGTFHFFAMTAMSMLGVPATTATSFAVVAHFVAVIPLTLVSVVVLSSDWLAWRRRGPRRAACADPAAPM